jgi:GNAT superfamily N-acetyltransferase
MSVDVEVADGATAELVEAFGRLLPQLSSTAKPLGQEALARVLACDANTVLIARVEGRVVGTLTLVMFPLPTGLRARIEDVVVDDAARGKGVGSVLGSIDSSCPDQRRRGSRRGLQPAPAPSP